jgi:FkbM family methyltransferase
LGSIYNSLSAALIKNINKAGIFNLGGHFILADAISPDSKIIDLGANKGGFYNFMYDRFNCTCYAVEASSELFQALPPFQNAHTFNYAISKENGVAEFYLSNESEANSLQPVIAANWGIKSSVTVRTITLGKFIADQKIQLPIDLLKIDIEGSEIDVIEQSSAFLLKEIKQIPVEFHDFLNFSADYKTGMSNAFKKLKENNFSIIRFSSYDNREILCINKSLITLTLNQKLRLKLVHPLLRNLKLLHTVLYSIFK